MNRTIRRPAKRAAVGTKRALFGTLGGRSPDWIIMGAMKSGTTSLHYALHQSRQAILPAMKEVHFFDYNWQRGMGWYQSHFARLPGMRTGEASPTYLLHPSVPERIAATVPDTKLIVLLRDPVDRAYSHWGHQVRAGREPLGFAEAIEAEPERLREADPDDPNSPHRIYSYLARGLYADQLERLYGYVDPSQVLVLRAEDLFDNFALVVGDICDWLGLKQPTGRRLARRNTGMKRPPMDEKLRRELARRYAESNRRLPALVGRDVAW